MTTPRDEGAPGAVPYGRADEQTLTDFPRAPEPPGAGRSTHHPTAFPSVSGPTGGAPRTDAEPPFTRADGQPDSVPPQMTVGSTGPAFSAGGDSRWRWVAAGLATVLVLAIVVGAFLFLGSQPPTPSLVADYVPANPVAFVELRLDMPGDQRERLATFMSNFPGFADPAAFQRKIDETLAKALRDSGTGLEWERDVAPWFGGMIGVFVTSVDPMSGAEPTGGVVLSIKDRAKLDELVNARIANAGLQQQEYRGRTIWSGATLNRGEPFAFTVTDDALLASPNIDDVTAALDARAGDTQGLADDSFFTTQMSELHPDRLGLFYYDAATILEEMPRPTAFAGGLSDDCFSEIASPGDVKVLGEVRAENDHMALNVRTQAPSGGVPQFPNRNTGLVSSMPSTTVAYAEYREIGASIKYYVEQFLECLPADAAPDLTRIQQMIGTPPQDYFDFLHDVAIGVTLNDGKFGGGFIGTVDDENVARTRLERLLSAIRLFAGMGEEITVEERQHGEATITVITLGGELVPEADVTSISLTVARGRLYVGVDEFVTTALDQTEQDSLATAPRLQSALSAIGHENAALMYADIGAMRAFIEEMIPASERSEYDTEVKPFVDPITQLVMVGTNEGGIYSSHVFLYVE